MKENADKQLDDLTRKVIQTTSLEKPSFDFTSNVMSEIDRIESTTSITYVPLISKRVWLILSALVITALLVIALGDINVTTGWLSEVGIERFYNFEISNPLSNISVPTTLVYAVGFFGLMLTIQIPLLKRYFDERLKV